jgi:hypothetical protein
VDAASIVTRMEQVQTEARDSVRPYAVTREYKLVKDGGEAESQVVAEVRFVPPHQKDYEIQSSAGNGQGPKVVKKVLDHEAEMSERWNETAITRENYDFALVGQEAVNGRNCYVLQLTPKRESKELLNGRAWVDAASFRLRRLNGTPSKSPSWWIKRLQITIEYGNVDGMWLQRSTSARAEVRLIGSRTLVGRDVSYKMGAVVASTEKSRTQRYSQPSALAASFN